MSLQMILAHMFIRIFFISLVEQHLYHADPKHPIY